METLIELIFQFLESVKKNLIYIAEGIASWVLTIFGCNLTMSYTPIHPMVILTDLGALMQIITLSLASLVSLATLWKIRKDMKKSDK